MESFIYPSTLKIYPLSIYVFNIYINNITWQIDLGIFKVWRGTKFLTSHSESLSRAALGPRVWPRLWTRIARTWGTSTSWSGHQLFHSFPEQARLYIAGRRVLTTNQYIHSLYFSLILTFNILKHCSKSFRNYHWSRWLYVSIICQRLITETWA